LLPASFAPGQGGVVIQDELFLPAWVVDLEAYRRWARTEAYPRRGWVSYLHGQIWVDLAMEELFTHNQVKGAYAKTIMNLPDYETRGLFVLDRMLLTNVRAELSTEPDGLFFLWKTVQDGVLRLLQETEGRILELEGTPDMVLEVLSKYSERKDTVLLRELYWKAGIPEYWLVDARGENPRFDILSHAKEGYVPVSATDGWLHSNVFGAQFRLSRHLNPLGKPNFVVATR
jgi:Uma2 family endonuclease